MAGVIFQKVTLRLARRLFSADLYLFKRMGEIEVGIAVVSINKCIDK